MEDAQRVFAHGEFGEAFARGCVFMKLEWMRFQDWFQATWQAMIPALNKMVEGVAKGAGAIITSVMSRIGEIRAQIEITWGDVSEESSGIICDASGSVDGLIDNIRQMMKDILVSLGLNKEHHYFWFDENLEDIEHSHMADTIGKRDACGQKGGR